MGWLLRVVGGSDMTFYGLGFWQVSFYKLNVYQLPYRFDGVY